MNYNRTIYCSTNSITLNPERIKENKGKTTQSKFFDKRSMNFIDANDVLI